MKKIDLIMRFGLMVLLSLSLVSCEWFGGGDEEFEDCYVGNCSSSTDTRNRSINVFDFNPASPYYNQVVANFSFTQATTSYTAPNYCTTCPFLDSEVTLRITNATNQTIHFDYNVTFQLNAVSWNYQGVATIGPNGTLNVGQISANPASISLGQFYIEGANLTYL